MNVSICFGEYISSEQNRITNKKIKYIDIEYLLMCVQILYRKYKGFIALTYYRSLNTVRTN